jgi:SnoaL-like domain
MNTHDEFILWHALHRLEATYWYDVDVNGGRTAHEFFVPDGVMVVGHNRFEGREKIKEFYEWRARQVIGGIAGNKTIRHLISNLHVVSRNERCAAVLGIVSFYGGVVHPSRRESKPPMLVADLVNECVLNKDDVWQFKSHVLRPVFLGHDTPPSMAIDIHH